MEPKTLSRMAWVVALIVVFGARAGAQTDSMPYRISTAGGGGGGGDLLLEETVAGRYYVPQDQHSLMTAAGALQVSTQTGYYQVVETDLELPGKNGWDLRITRRYDVGTARREKEKAVTELALAEKAYSVGTGWRLDLPFVHVLPNAPAWSGPLWDREKFVYVTLPSGAKYALRDMSLIATPTNLRVYFNIKEVTFRVLCYTNTNMYKLVMPDGTIYSMNASGLVTTIDGRAPDGRRDGPVNIAYSSNLINTITDTRGRVLTFTYATVSSLPQITQIALTNDPASLHRRATYTYETGTRKLSQAALVAGPTGQEVSHAWTHQYEDTTLTSKTGTANPVTVQVPLLAEVTDWRGSRSTISRWDVERFEGRGDDYRDVVLVRGVENRDRVFNEEGALYERLASRTALAYTSLVYSQTGETYIQRSVETRTDIPADNTREIRYEFWTLTETDWAGQSFVHTKPRWVKTMDPSGLADYLETTEYVYYYDVWKVGQATEERSGGDYRETNYDYDSFGNAKLLDTASYAADRHTRKIQWTKHWGADYQAPDPDAPWRGDYPYTPSYPTDYLQPTSFPMHSVLATYYPYWSGSQIINYNTSQVQYLHSAYNYDSQGQRTGATRYDGAQWLSTTYTYTAAGRPQTVTRPGGLVTTYAYNESYATDLELVTATQYDAAHIVDAETGSHEIITKAATDTKTGWTKWTMSGRGYVTENTYDVFGRTSGIVLPDVNETDDTAYLAPEDSGFAATRANNPTVGIEYNDTDLWVETTDPEGRVSRTWFASFLKPERTTWYNPGGTYTEVVTDYDYDGWQRMVARKDPPNGTDGSYSGQRTTSYEYDILGNLTKQVHPDGEQITWERDYATGLVTKTNERGYITEIQLDFDDAPLAVTEYDGSGSRTRARYYDGAGIVRIDKDAKDNYVQRTYTDLLQLKRIEFPNDPQNAFFEKGYELTTYPQPYVEYAYNPDGVRVTNTTTVAGGQVHTIEYVVDGLGRGIELRLPYTDDGGAKTAITLVGFDADGNKIDVVDANNSPLEPEERKHLVYAYSPAGTLLSRTDPEANRADFTYHQDGRIATITDPRGTSGNYPSFPGDFSRSYEFDELGRLLYVDYPLDVDGVTRPRVSYGYYPSGTVAAITAPDGGLVSYEYTARSQANSREVSGDGRAYETRYYYDERGNRIQTVYPGNAAATRMYDAWDRLVELIHPEGNNERWEYDDNDKVTAYVDGEGNRTELIYDRYDRIKQLKDAKLEDTDFWYDRLGTLTKVADPTDRILTFDYDELGRLTDQKEVGPNYLRHYQYDLVGNLLHATDPRGTTADYDYDWNNRLLELVRTNGAVTETVALEYDEGGYRKQVSEDGVVIDYNRSGGNYLPDPYGRIRGERTSVEGQTLPVDYSYDSVGRVTGVRGPDAAWVNYDYNRVGELLQVPGFVDQDVTYTQAGYPELAVMANGTRLSWRFDLNGRLVEKDYTDGVGAPIKTYDLAYDRADNVVWKNDTYYEYDELNQLVRERRSETLERREPLGPIGVVRDDFVGGKGFESFHTGTELIELDYAAGSIGVDLGAQVAVSRVELLPASPVHRVGTRHLSVWTSGDGVSWTRASGWYSRKKSGGIIEVVFLAPTSLRYLKLHCGYDERDIEFAAVDEAEFSNSADSILRVYTTSEVTSEDEFTYDGAGNRVSEILTEGGVPAIYQSLYYSGTHRLKANGRWGYQYDANGNLVKKGSSYTVNGDEVTIAETGEWWDYSYDLANRLTGVSHNGAAVASYRYDAWGRRVRRSAGEGTTYFAFDQWGRVIYERTGASYREQVYAFGDQLARVDGTIVGETHTAGPKYFYASDHLGTVEAMTDESGAVVWQASYTAFGVVTSQSGSIEGPPIYAGKELDEASGLYYFNARWYDPEVGRFITEDPAEDGLNWYVYTRNNPATYTDPTGLDSYDDACAAAYGDSAPEPTSPQPSEPQSDGAPSGGVYQGHNITWYDPPSAPPTTGGSGASKPSEPAPDTSPEGSGGVGIPGPNPPSQPSPPPGPGGPEGNGNDNPEGGGGGLKQGGTTPGLPTVTQVLRDVSEGIGRVPPPRTAAQNDPRISDIPNMKLKGCYFRTLQAVAEFYVGRALREDERQRQIHDAVRRMQRLKVKRYPEGDDVVAAEMDMRVRGPDQVIEDAFKALGHPNMRVQVGGYPPPPGSTLIATILRGGLPSGEDHFRLGDAAGGLLWDPWDPTDGPLSIAGEEVFAEIYVWYEGTP